VKLGGVSQIVGAECPQATGGPLYDHAPDRRVRINISRRDAPAEPAGHRGQAKSQLSG
jgi:hypothetical protein